MSYGQVIIYSTYDSIDQLPVTISVFLPAFTRQLHPDSTCNPCNPNSQSHVYWRQLWLMIRFSPFVCRVMIMILFMLIVSLSLSLYQAEVGEWESGCLYNNEEGQVWIDAGGSCTSLHFENLI